MSGFVRCGCGRLVMKGYACRCGHAKRQAQLASAITGQAPATAGERLAEARKSKALAGAGPRIAGK